MNGNDPKPSGQEIPNIKAIKGLLSVIFGLVLIIFASSIVLQITLFMTGAFLIYYGLVLLEMKQAVSYLDRIINTIKSFFHA